MAKLVKLSLEGDINSGYQVKLIEISEEKWDGKVFIEGIGGKLPPAADIYECYQTWQQSYEQLDQIYRGGEFRFLKTQNSPTVSLENCKNLALTIQHKINHWLKAADFRIIADKILTILDPLEDVRFLIKTNDYKLWQLPWSAWDFFESHPNAEVVFSSLDAKSCEKPIKVTPRKNVRILSVFGNSKNINTNPDREQIERLKSVGAEPITPITEPTVQTLRDLLWDQSWDIFFFAGHGDRDKESNQGKIYLNSEEALTPSEFKSTLKTAIVDHGLKIAFLNSCLGLEFAYQLVQDFKIPVVIAMREPIPDHAAQKFLEYFLIEYADNGRPLYVAVRRAKERMAEESQSEYPCLDWLPVVCQNPASIPPMWNQLHRKISGKQAGFASVAATVFVMLLRGLVLLQPFELSSLDYLKRLRPPEPPDPRLLIVTVTAEDLNYYKQDPLTDNLVEELLSKLLTYQPRVIGLDIFRDFPQPAGDFEAQRKLTQLIAQPENSIFAICKAQETDAINAPNIGVGPPPNVSVDRLGFADVLEDPDRIIRRQLLTMVVPAPDLENEEPCSPTFSLNFQLVLAYLGQENIRAKQTYNGDLLLDQVVFKRLKNKTGVYQNIDDVGYQIMTNFRSPDAQKNIANTVSLKQVLSNNLDANLIKDRVVLIGYTAESATGSDFLPTLYSPRTPGVMVQAHMVSQMLSAVLDGRPLLWNLPDWGSFLWVLAWSSLSGFAIWRIQKLSILGIVGAIFIIVIFSSSFLCVWIYGAWVPLVPSLLTLTIVLGGYAMFIIYISMPKP
ncbi:MAG: CHASE2 domain-containing protein [Planktothrix sp.]